MVYEAEHICQNRKLCHSHQNSVLGTYPSDSIQKPSDPSNQLGWPWIEFKVHTH